MFEATSPASFSLENRGDRLALRDDALPIRFDAVSGTLDKTRRCSRANIQQVTLCTTESRGFGRGERIPDKAAPRETRARVGEMDRGASSGT